MTSENWSILLSHYYDKKDRDREEFVQILEYIAVLISSMNPEAVNKHIAKRRSQKKMADLQRQNPEEFMKVNSQGQNELGHHINTTFFDTLKKIGGEAALKEFESPVDYKIDPEKSIYVDEEEEEFIKKARKFAEQRRKDLEAEKKFKEEHPELFKNTDTIIL